MIGPGRPRDAIGLRIDGVRVLIREDLAQLREGARPPATVQKLRDIHHTMARMYAAGMGHKSVASLTGYSYNRVCMLHSTPQMADLIARYRQDGDLIETTLGPVDVATQLAMKAHVTALRHLVHAQEEADEAGEYLPVRQSLSIFAETGDRAGLGKRSTQVNVNLDFAARLESAIRRSHPKLVEGVPVGLSTNEAESVNEGLVREVTERLRRIA